MKVWGVEQKSGGRLKKLIESWVRISIRKWCSKFDESLAENLMKV